jgi:acetyl-CoA synthetase (ADP-forming)
MSTVEEILAAAQSNQRTALTEFESKQLLENIGLPITRQVLCTTKADALSAAQGLGFPVVMKLMAESVIHKTDVGAVKLGLTDDAAVETAFDDLMAIPAEGVKQVSVQEMAPAPICEVIIGSTQDPQFGPAIMFGIGGVLVEVMKDVAFRITPLTRFDAEEMIHEIKGFQLLDGYRGKPKADLGALVEAILKLSDLAETRRDIAEMDLNPIFVYPDGLKVVDARVILRPGPA